MPRRFDAGPATALLGAAVLAVSLFVDWYDPGVTAWGAFESLDVLLLALAALMAGAVLAPDGPNGRLVLGASLAAFVVVVTQLIQPPPVIDAVDGGLRLGAWLALAGTLLGVVGSVLAVAAISINVDVAGRDARRRATAVDRRAAGASGPDARSPFDEEEDDVEEDEDDDRPSRGSRRASVAARPPVRRPDARPSGGSLFSRGRIGIADEDEPEDTVAAPLDPQATQAFARVDDDDEDDARPASRPGR